MGGPRGDRGRGQRRGGARWRQSRAESAGSQGGGPGSDGRACGVLESVNSALPGLSVVAVFLGPGRWRTEPYTELPRRNTRPLPGAPGRASPPTSSWDGSSCSSACSNSCSWWARGQGGEPGPGRGAWTLGHRPVGLGGQPGSSGSGRLHTLSSSSLRLGRGAWPSTSPRAAPHPQISPG